MTTADDSSASLVAASTKARNSADKPENKVRPERDHSVRREAAKCACGLELSLTGECFSCD
jgi:hypothetical protein